MLVHTPLLNDFTNFPLVIDNIYIDKFGHKWVIPHIASDFELWFGAVKDTFFIFFDFNNFKTELLNKLELISLNIYHWLVKLTYTRLINEFKYSMSVNYESNLFVPSNWLLYFTNIYIILFIFYITILTVYTYVLRNTSTNLGLTEGGIFLYAYLDEIEEECGQIEDVISYIVYFSLFVLWFFFFNVFAAAIIIKYMGWFLIIFSLILIMGVVVPNSVFLQIGLAFVQYIRGSAKSTLLFFETLLDFVSVSVIIIRFFVQNIRFVFIFVGFFEYFEFIESKIQPLSHIVLPYISWDDYWAGKFNNWYWFEILFQLISQSVMYIYYIGHFIITYIAQLSIYLILSFWIFFFLYTTFSLPSKEKYFFFKKQVLLIKC